MIGTKKDNFLKKNNCSVFSKLENCLNENPTAAIICNETSLHVKIATKLIKNNNWYRMWNSWLAQCWQINPIQCINRF